MIRDEEAQLLTFRLLERDVSSPATDTSTPPLQRSPVAQRRWCLRPLQLLTRREDNGRAVKGLSRDPQGDLLLEGGELVSQEEKERLFKEASEYIRLFYRECGRGGAPDERLAEVRWEIEQRGTYRQTSEELRYGAKVAWRNSTRCIGRLTWESLTVRDLRHLRSAEDILAALIEHIRLATNGGKIRPMITIFAAQPPVATQQAGIRIWNPQLIRYAGYHQADGSIIGDPAHVELTEQLQHLGWRGGKRTPFDLLPIVIQMPGQEPKMVALPNNVVLEVPINHPNYPWFSKLGLKWHALPVISNMCLAIGGLRYTAAPFNGWYMGTEIGARNLGDSQRYNQLPVIAERMGLNTGSDRTMWKDRALVELNIAVLDSFGRKGVTIVDHHTAARQFMQHEQREKQAGRCMYADWGWIVPPLSGSTTPVFHTAYEDRTVMPNFLYQEEAWKSSARPPGCPV